MRRLRRKYVQSFGGYHYFRRPGYKRIRLPGLPGSREFMAAYQDALDQPYAQIGTSRSRPGTVAAAVAAYLLSPQFSELALGTQGARRRILQHFRDDHGDKPIGSMPSKFIALVLGTKKPYAARNHLKAIRA